MAATGLGAAASAMLLAGCSEDLIEAVVGSCPTDPAESGGISWAPDVGRPVLAGFEDVGAVQGAPRPMRIFYPTFTGATTSPGWPPAVVAAPILKMCLIRWPVVLFLHGQPPAGVPVADYHKLWTRIPAVLARSGYVVAVPSHNPGIPVPDTIAAARADLQWVRTDWQHAEWVNQQPGSAAVAGHSFGALLASQVAAEDDEIGALMSFSGGFLELSDAVAPLRDANIPMFFMWAEGGLGTGLIYENLDDQGIFDSLAGPKHAAVFLGEHFDYLPDGNTGPLRGPCPHIGAAAADLAALFLSRYVRVPLSVTTVPADLQPPEVQLTDEQQLFARGHLTGLSDAAGEPACRIRLRWDADGQTGAKLLSA